MKQKTAKKKKEFIPETGMSSNACFAVLNETNLHGHRKVILCFRRKEDIHCFLWKWLITSWWGSHLNNVQLGQAGKEKKKKKRTWLNLLVHWFLSSHIQLEWANDHLSSSLAPHSKAEQSWLFCVSFNLELGEAGSMAFNGLRNLSFNGVELHGSHHSVLLQNKIIYIHKHECNHKHTLVNIY